MLEPHALSVCSIRMLEPHALSACSNRMVLPFACTAYSTRMLVPHVPPAWSNLSLLLQLTTLLTTGGLSQFGLSDIIMYLCAS
jgi:hypothetical protein